MQGESFQKELQRQQQLRLDVARRKADAIAKARLMSTPAAVLRGSCTNRVQPPVRHCNFYLKSARPKTCQLAERTPG
jgi:hypothetical protein